MRIVLKIGGSVLRGRSSSINMDVVNGYSALIRKLVDKSYSVLAVVGGGNIAREYITYLRSLGASESLCDEVGIDCSRLNSMVLIASLKELAYPFTIQSFREALKLLSLNKVLVMGGVQPGQSTNAVAALLAETVSADYLINLTNVDGVYSSNPLKDPKAELLKEVSTLELEKILSQGSAEAGEYPLFDPLAIRIVRRSNIPTWIINGKDPENVFKVIRGDKIGTRVVK